MPSQNLHRGRVTRRRFLTTALAGVAGAAVAGSAVADTLADVPGRLFAGPCRTATDSFPTRCSKLTMRDRPGERGAPRHEDVSRAPPDVKCSVEEWVCNGREGDPSPSPHVCARGRVLNNRGLCALSLSIFDSNSQLLPARGEKSLVEWRNDTPPA